MRNSDSAQRVRRFLRAERRRRGWSQTDLAKTAGVSRGTVAALENGMALREGNEGVIEEALGLDLGTIEDVRRDRHSADPPPETAPERPLSEPQPQDYPDEMEYLNAQYWYMREGLGMSHDAVIRGFNMAAAIYARKKAQRVQSDTDSEKLG